MINENSEDSLSFADHLRPVLTQAVSQVLRKSDPFKVCGVIALAVNENLETNCSMTSSAGYPADATLISVCESLIHLLYTQSTETELKELQLEALEKITQLKEAMYAQTKKFTH